MPALETVPVPARGLQIWNVYMDVINCRSKPTAPILWTELQAYLKVRDLTLDNWDVNTFIAMDQAYRNAVPKD